ncbi:PTS glucitol/sorbitol transporter subunit IIA [Bisgaard Taxon 45]|uniref:PTS glucitol/sorbitol transporter subunit IIA n=1 Tax=Bisgaard Taxon 45 TaxID=304289 RepID=A0ABT9KH61_9PAST|nr:PTS glucitol/sorbitol transporter subunit IIA [Bisgaard Taxon 45]
MKTLYQTKFTDVGGSAAEALEDGMLITFKQGVPEGIVDYCYILAHGELLDDLQVGDQVNFDQQTYFITAIGNVANKNLRELGHVTWRFDSATEAEFPGSIHLQGTPPQSVAIDSVLIIKRDEE